MNRVWTFSFALLALIVLPANAADSSQTWSFAVSGDSRNCGDIVMPAIAADALKHNVAFYWHLGDLRAIYGPDEDFVQERRREGKSTDLAEYEKDAWDDFIANQMKPWDETPFFLGIGNHETTPPKSRAAFIEQFHEYLDRPEIREQRLKDDSAATEPKTYYHWMRDGIDFIYLDNATGSDFEPGQVQWVKGVLDRDRKDNAIHTIVVGMHEALPQSISANHSMNESPMGVETGTRVYRILLSMQNDAHKMVYVLASHSHYFMDGIYNTEYWKSNGGVLPGWIIGTAGAERYPLPPDSRNAKAAKTNVYGYLMATVNPEGKAAGTIEFKFEELKEDNIPKDVMQRFTKPFVRQCFIGNRRNIPIH
jgi:hypothetical protein